MTKADLSANRYERALVSESPKLNSPLIETRSIDWIPHGERTGKVWHQAPLWFLGNFQYFSIALGFIGPGLGLSLWWTVVASVLGISVGTIFMAFHATQGPTMGLPQLIQSRAQFGFRGVVVPLVAALLTYVGFIVLALILLGQGLQTVFGISPAITYTIGTVAAGALAICGHDSVHRVFRILLYISVPLIAIVSIGILLGVPVVNEQPVALGFSWGAFLAQLAACAAYNIVYAPYVSDYSRYLPVGTPPWKVITSVFLGAATSAIWLIALGSWLTVELGAQDALQGLRQVGDSVVPGLGTAAAILSALALLGSTGMSLYGAMLVALTAVDCFRPFAPTRAHRIIGVVAIALICVGITWSAGDDVLNTVSVGLTLMLYLLVPWTAINLVDYFFIQHANYVIADLFTPTGRYGAWAWRGLGAYAIGLVAEYPFMVLGSSYMGPIASLLGGIDLAWLVGLAVSGGVYWFSATFRRDAAPISAQTA